MENMEYLWHWLEIQRMFSEKTRAAFAERARLANDNEAAASLSDFKTHFTRSIRSSSWSDVGFKFGGMADPIVRGRVKADRFIRDLAKFLRESPPFILPYLHSSPPKSARVRASAPTRKLAEDGLMRRATRRQRKPSEPIGPRLQQGRRWRGLMRIPESWPTSMLRKSKGVWGCGLKQSVQKL